MFPELHRILRDIHGHASQFLEVHRNALRPGPGPSDPVMEEAGVMVSLALLVQQDSSGLIAATNVLLRDPDFALLRPRPGEPDPMVRIGGGGVGGGARLPPDEIISDLITSAMIQIYFRRMTGDLETLIGVVDKSLDELRLSLSSGRAKMQELVGFIGIEVPEHREIRTGWGTLVPVQPRLIQASSGFQQSTTAVLVREIEVEVEFDRGGDSESGPGDLWRLEEARAERARMLFPLACALGSAKPRLTPLPTWRTVLNPFSASIGYSPTLVSTPLPARQPQTITGDEISSTEKWAAVIEDRHVDRLDLAVRRILSASSGRSNQEDQLIDAVIAWENLFGTSQETAFRLTAATVNLLVSEKSTRRRRRRELGKVYGVRSKISHGVALKRPQRGGPGIPDELSDAVDEAIDTVYDCLRHLYTDRTDLLADNSEARSEKLLLE